MSKDNKLEIDDMYLATNAKLENMYLDEFKVALGDKSKQDIAVEMLMNNLQKQNFKTEILHHYTNISALSSIVRFDGNPITLSLRLTEFNNENLNDGYESSKGHIYKEDIDKTLFIVCFSRYWKNKADNMAMWQCYGKPYCEGLRISIKRSDFSEALPNIKVYSDPSLENEIPKANWKIVLTNIFYIFIPKTGDKIIPLTYLNWESKKAYMKNRSWEYEKECRLIVKVEKKNRC